MTTVYFKMNANWITEEEYKSIKNKEEYRKLTLEDCELKNIPGRVLYEVEMIQAYETCRIDEKE